MAIIVQYKIKMLITVNTKFMIIITETATYGASLYAIKYENNKNANIQLNKIHNAFTAVMHFIKTSKNVLKTVVF